MTRPVLFVLDEDRSVLDVLLSDLDRRFGNDFSVKGDASPAAALRTLEAMAKTSDPVALLLVEDKQSEFLTRAHELHPQAKRVLLVDRDYSSSSPAVQAMALGRADYHIVRPWSDDEMMYGAMSEYLGAWTREQEPNFELFRIVADDGDPRLPQLRGLIRGRCWPVTGRRAPRRAPRREPAAPPPERRATGENRARTRTRAHRPPGGAP